MPLLSDEELERAAQIPLPPSPIPSESRKINNPTNADDPEIASKNTTSIPGLYLNYVQSDDAALMSQWNADLDVQFIFVSIQAATACFLSDF